MVGAICDGVFICCDLVGSNSKNEVETLVGKTLILPSKLTVQALSKESEIELQRVHKIITFINADECIPCLMKLQQWSQVIEEFRRDFSSEFMFVMIVESKLTKEIMIHVKNEHFSHPILFDDANKIKNENKIATEYEYQTFLLSPDNKILAVGNPTINAKIKKLYVKLINNSEITK